jgi:cobalt-precorrin 5A hydrolase/precorrin-3B C17-methyltransferase
MKVLSIARTAAGRALAERLPYPMATGDAKGTFNANWEEVDGFVVFLAVGATIRLIGPLLGTKHTDPAVVCVDELGSVVIPLIGGHHGGNHLAHEIGGVLGAQVVITTATDQRGLLPLDTLGGLSAEGDYRGVAARMLDGERPRLINPLGWPVTRLDQFGTGPSSVLVTDAAQEAPPGTCLLRPQSLVVGIGCSSDATPQEIDDALEHALTLAQLSRRSVHSIATLDRRAQHPSILALGLPISSYPPEQLSRVPTPHPSEIVRASVGTPSVSEAAALLGARTNALLLEKQVFPKVTIAIARRRHQGHLSVVGVGPGAPEERTARATRAIRHAQAVVGFSGYLDLIGDLTREAQDLYRSPIGAEVDRVNHAITLTTQGYNVALVCSGDAGIYALATLVFEQLHARDVDIEVEVVPGVTAAVSAAARLGAPLGHDHVAISLSDLLTPWEVISQRVALAGEGDFVVTFYNPRSQGRAQQLGDALAILAKYRPPSTPVGVVRNIGRDHETQQITTLATFDPQSVDMLSTVIVGSSTTRRFGKYLYTPRGYLL